MGRLTASIVRTIVDEIQSAEKEAKKQERLDAARSAKIKIQTEIRRRNLWKNLYLSAINGGEFYDAVNLDPDDIEYFSKIGFNISELYARRQDYRYLKNRLTEIHKLEERKSNKIFDLNDDIINYESNPDGLDFGHL